MHKLGKILLISLVSLLLFVLTGMVALIFLVSPDKFKDQIAQQIANHSGYQVTINGSIKWSLFPTFGIVVTQVDITSPQSASNYFTSHIGEIKMNVQLLPLLQKQIESDSIVLQDLNVVFKKPPLSTTSTVASKPQTKLPVSSTTSPTDSNTQSGTPLALHLHKVVLKNATLNWENSATSKPTLTIASFEADDINFAERPFPFSLKLMLTNGLSSSSGELDIQGFLLSTAQMKQFELQQIKTSLTLHSVLANGRKLTTKTNSTLNATFPDTHFTLKDLQLELNKMALAGTLKGKLKPEFQVNGNLDIKPFNLFEFLQSLGIEINTRDPAVLDNVKASFNLEMNPRTISLDNIHANVDSNTITGNLKLSHAPNAVAFNLRLDQINLGRMLPAEAGQNSLTQSELVVRKTQKPVDNKKINEIATAAQTQATTYTPNNSFIREANLNGSIHTNKLIWGDFFFENFSATIKGQQGIITIQPLAAQFYGGGYSGSLQLDMRTTIPRYTVVQKIENVSIQNLIKSSGKNSLTGILNASCNVNTSGVENTQLIRNANGTFNINIRDGKIQGADIMQAIDSAYAQYKMQKKNAPAAVTNSSTRTEFSSLNAAFQIQNGMAHTNNIVINSQGINATGSGIVNLVNQNIDFSLEANITNTAVKSILKLQNTIGGSIPIKVTGTISNPVISVNYAVFIERVMQAQINKQLDKLGKKIGLPVDGEGDPQQQLKDIGKQLKSIFK